MIFCAKSHAKRHIFLLNSFVSYAAAKFAFCQVTLSSSSLLKFSHSTSNTLVHQEANCTYSTKDSDLDFLIAKVRAASNNNEIFQSLMHDQTCNAIHVSHNLVNKLLHQFKDDWKAALGVFRWVESRPGYKPLSESYDMLVDILGKMKQMEMMWALLEEMREVHLVTFSTIAKVMRRFAGAGKWEEAVRTFDELGSFGLEKNTVSMNLLLDTLCKEKKVEQARSVFLKLKSHIPPSAHTFNIFIHGWCKANRVDEAQWTIQEMKGHGCRPCVISYSTIIQSYCHQFNFNKVYDLLDEMEAQGCPPNVVTFTTIMCSLTKSGDFEEALQIPERMKSVGCEPDTLFYNTLIHTLGRAHRVQEAIHIFEVEMPRIGIAPNTSTYNSMITMLCHHAQEQKALNILRDMDNSQYCKPDVQSFFPLLKWFFRTGKTDSCLSDMLDDMVNKHHLSLDFSTYTLLIHGLCRDKKCEWAYILFQEMIARDITPRYRTCRLLLGEIQLKNMYDAAEMIQSVIKQRKPS